MPEPIEYRILLNLQAALAAMTVAGGYYFTVGATAVKLDPNSDVESLIEPSGPRPFVLIEVRKERWEYFPANEVRLVLPFTVHWIPDFPTAGVDASLPQMYFRGCADVEKAIAVDPGRGTYPDASQGSLAIDTRITGRRMREIENDSSIAWAMVDIDIPLRRTFGVPSA